MRHPYLLSSCTLLELSTSSTSLSLLTSDDEHNHFLYSYHKLALKYHPHKNKSPGAEQKFIEVAEAYDVLSDGEWQTVM